MSFTLGAASSIVKHMKVLILRSCAALLNDPPAEGDVKDVSLMISWRATASGQD